MDQSMKYEKGSGALRMLLVLIIVFAGAAFLYRSWHSGKSVSKKLHGYTPPFTLKDTRGEEFSSYRLIGKPAVINFFTTWCPSCRAEIPGFITVYEEYKDKGFELIGIALDGDAATVSNFINAQKINYMVLMGNMETVRTYGGFTAVPMTFFVGKDGKINKIMAGYISKEVFEMEVQKLMN